MEIFYVGQDDAKWCDVSRRAVRYVEGAGRLPMPQVGVRGSSPGKFFAKISSEKGLLGQF